MRLAAHFAAGRKAIRSLLGRGYCHVYFTYGSSFMVNVTSEEPGIGAGVLLRALEPLEGIDTMKRFRKKTLHPRHSPRSGAPGRSDAC